MTIHLWLRAELKETKAQRGTRDAYEVERRSVLAPAECASLLADGDGKFRITVERSDTRIYADEDYASAG